ncbi:hypothetical protein MTO96_042152 [Rhipicephalus appendiculatus]
MFSPEGNQRSSEFSVSSFGGSVPEVVKRSPPDADEAEGAPGVGTQVNEHDMYCGALGMYPEFLQRYRTPVSYLICVCLLGHDARLRSQRPGVRGHPDHRETVSASRHRIRRK